jgi:D-alanyl-D-alanine carboxypeptidase (penicillin-binding protein 5/6)
MKLLARASLALLIVLFVFPVPQSSPAAQPADLIVEPPRVTADAAILVDVRTGHVFFAKNEKHRNDPASLTKVITAIVALEAGRPGDVVTVSERAARFGRGSVIDLRTGEKITLENLLKAALIMSANDCTIAIGEHVAGDYDLFVRWMNLKARQLGAYDTRFQNTHGFTHPNHYSTAADLAEITRYALRIPHFAALVRTREITVYWREPDRKRTIRNTNRLLRSDYEGIDGVKTGTTSAAGHCLIASATRDGRQLVAVVLHSDGRYQDARRLLNYGFALEPIEAATRGEQITRLMVREGVRPDVAVVPAETVKLYLPAEQLPLLEKEVRLRTELEAPVAPGVKLGEMSFRINGRQLAQVDLTVGYGVARKPWYTRLR